MSDITYNNQKRIEVAAAVIIHNNKVLMTKRDDSYLNNLWEFPGGKLENNENALNAAERELLEELNIKVIPQKTIMILEHDYPDKKVRLHFVVCNIKPIESNVNTLNDCNWFDPFNLPLSDLCPADRIAAENIPWPDHIKQ